MVNEMSAKEIIDLRSDTVTLPTEEMLEAIRHAELGDDVFREDPTVNRLEALAAEKMGKEAALLVTSGTQANLAALMSNTKRGDLVILESESHIYWYEVGGISMIAGLLPWPVKSSFGAPTTEDIEAAIRPRDIHFPEPALVCLENTHNRHGGTIITPSQIKAVSGVAQAHGLKLYLDGARIFNAAVALGVDVKEFTRHVDNLMFSLSKGLCCPVGSLLVGTQEFIEKARKIRKLLGGGMRQAGIIAAPGIVALETMIDRLAEDHQNARRLAEGIARLGGIQIDLSRVQTNIVCFDISGLGVSANEFLLRLKANGVLALAMGKHKVRLVTHRGIGREHVEKAVAAIEAVAKVVSRNKLKC
jgi:threonine aldolase